MRINTWTKKPIAFIVMLAVVIGTITLPGMNSLQAYADYPETTATLEDASAAIEKVANYYNTRESKQIEDWEVLLSILAVNDVSSGAIDLSPLYLPTTGLEGTYSNILLELLKGYYPGNWINALSDSQDTTTGAFASNANDHAWAMLTLQAADALPLDKGILAAEYLLAQPFDPTSGGFFDSWGYATLDNTGVVAMALAPYRNTESLASSIAAIGVYLDNKQEDTGGYASWGSESASTTSYVINGLAALRINPYGVVTGTGVSAVDSLLHYQNTNGSFWGPYNPAPEIDSFATKQAPQALWSAIKGWNTTGSAYNTLLSQNNIKSRTVTVSVTGDNGGSTIIPSKTFTVQTSDSALTVRNGLDAFLEQDAKTATYFEDKVASVSGITASDDERWYVLVNGVEDVASYEIGDGDVIELRAGLKETIQITMDSNQSVLDLRKAQEETPVMGVVASGCTNPSLTVGSDTLPQVAIISNNANGVRLLIPQGTTVTSSSIDWDGTIALPTTTTVALSGKTVSSAILVGSADHELTFDQPVRLLLPGSGNKKVGFIDNAGTFTEITQSLVTDTVHAVSQELADAGRDVGKYVSGNDMVVWTKHFTTFVTYVDAASDNSGGSVSTATLRVYGYDGARSTTILENTSLVIGNRDTPITLLDKAGLDYDNQGGYIAAIEGLEERDFGQDSGWKYSVNGTFPSAGASNYILKNGDAVVWRFVTALNEGEILGGTVVTGEAVTVTAISQAAITEAVSRFSDINPSEWYGTAVGSLVAQGILSGRSETIFAPMDTITRAEFAMILAKAAGADLTVTRANGFNDVDASNWYAPAVAWAKEAGIVSGYKNSDGTHSFRPSDVILRQDMALMIQKFLLQQNGEGLATTKEAIAFKDEAEIASYAKTAVASMQKAGIINGVQRGQDAYFLPRNTATRAEATVMIWQALQNK